jgi:hypothetical protein
MSVPQTTIGFLDESGDPEIPHLRAPGATDNVFCVGHCFMGIHYWQELRDIYKAVRRSFDIDPERELKWKNLIRCSGPARHMNPDAVYVFIESLVDQLDATKFKGVAVSLFKDEIYASKGYVREAQDIYNIGVFFALQRLQNELDERHGKGTNVPTLIVADTREKGGQDNRLRKFVHQAASGSGGGLWVSFDKSLVEGVLFQVSHYSVGVQIADLIAGATFQKDARGDDTFFRLWAPVLRKSPTGDVDGYGYVQWRG